MVDTKRLCDYFARLVETDSPTFGERMMCDRLKKYLSALGIESSEDGAGGELNGNAGNLYAYLDGEAGLEPLLFSTHMDTVEPSRGKKAVFLPDGKIVSDGTTVLGADDLAGVAAILEALSVLSESSLPHRPIELVFSVAEEDYCAGIRHFDLRVFAYTLETSVCSRPERAGGQRGVLCADDTVIPCRVSRARCARRFFT
jgi:tripeptide aminopeptidase